VTIRYTNLANGLSLIARNLAVVLTVCLNETKKETKQFPVEDPIWVRRIENRVPRIRENYHRVSIGPYRVPNFSFKKTWVFVKAQFALVRRTFAEAL